MKQIIILLAIIMGVYCYSYASSVMIGSGSSVTVEAGSGSTVGSTVLMDSAGVSVKGSDSNYIRIAL